MRSIPATLLLTFAAACAAAPESPSDSPRGDPRAAAVDAHLAGLPWNGVALVAVDGDVLLHRGYGMADFESDAPCTPATRFRVASVSKMFAAMAARILVERGKLDVERPITDYLEDAPEPWSRITTSHLIHHTSGLSDYEGWFDGYDTQAYSDFMSADDAGQRIVARARPLPLDFEPGTQYSYSNTAYVVLGLVVEAAAGEDFDAFCQREIFDRLGMASTLQDVDELIVPDRARGYAIPERWRDMPFSPERLERANYQRMEPPMADSGLLTTAEDLFRWEQSLEGETLVSRAGLDEIFRPDPHGDYGYGWFVREMPFGVAHSHTGGLPGFSCILYRVPERDWTIIMLSNIEHGGTRPVSEIVRILAAG